MTKLDKLIKSLEVLSSSADSQIEYLKSIGHFDSMINTGFLDLNCNVDELGQQFDDVEVFLDGLVDRMEITSEQADRIQMLGRFLSENSGSKHAVFWTVNGLKNDRRWDIARHLARECLNRLRGEEQ